MLCRFFFLNIVLKLIHQNVLLAGCQRGHDVKAASVDQVAHFQIIAMPVR